jgi:hypothetical protein
VPENVFSSLKRKLDYSYMPPLSTNHLMVSTSQLQHLTLVLCPLPMYCPNCWPHLSSLEISMQKNSLWGSEYNSDKGLLIADMCSRSYLTLLSTGENTHLSLTSGTFSVLELALCSPALSVQLEWSALPDLYGSNHFSSPHL